MMIEKLHGLDPPALPGIGLERYSSVTYPCETRA